MKYIIGLLAISCTLSCTKVIDIRPAAGQEKVIIQGYLYKDSSAVVVVSKSVDFLSTVRPPSIGTAIVTLEDNHGISETLTWNPVRHVYESNLVKGVVNDTYTLKIDLEGKTYKAVSELPDLEPVDSITVEKDAADIFRPEGYYMKMYGTISTTPSLYYLFKGFQNGKFMNRTSQINYATNEGASGKLNRFDVGYEYEVNDVAMLKIFSLTKKAYDFYSAANLQLNNDGGFFSTPPANVPTMFDNGAIGLFQCSTIQRLTTIVKEQ